MAPPIGDTLALSTMMSRRRALFLLRGRPDPLGFPGTADVSFNGSALRGMWPVRCVLSFFFNTTVLVLTINIVAGLF